MNEPNLDRELLEWLDALCIETITPEQQGRLNERLKNDPAARQAYLAYVDVHLGLRRLMPAAPAQSTPPEPLRPAAGTAAQDARVPTLSAGLVALAASLLLYFGYSVWNSPSTSKTAERVTDLSPVRLANSAGARFFGEIAPPIASQLPLKRDYVLLSGMVELAFPAGATAIVEGPAVFRILSDTSLGLDVGQCSVHAPSGAEGFRVETQQANIVDRGTRFSIKVSETSETEVHVVEGMADVYRQTPGKGQPAGEPLARLRQHEARGLADDSQTVRDVAFSANGYRKELPDRVISYQATTDGSGGAVDLVSVTMQRNGQPRTFAVADMIGVEPVWFRSGDGTDRNGHLTSGGTLAPNRIDVLRDRSLVTGLLNPGGNPQPLAGNPVMNLPEDPERPNTPGMALRFARPVTNGPGPDVVLFEMQTVTNPADGDAFHVSPLKFSEGLRSHTVRGFDIAMTSAEAKKLAGFHLYRFETPIKSLAELQAGACHPTPLRRNFRVLAVGIDLSRLGHPAGALVEGIFLQDAADDDHKCDPVFVGGLPE